MNIIMYLFIPLISEVIITVLGHIICKWYDRKTEK